MVYVGSTTQTISRRWAEHMKSVRRKKIKHLKIYRAIEELGVENFYIEFVEAFPCENKGQLCAREGHHIRLMDSVKNGYNDRVAGRTKNQRYEEDNEYRENQLKKQKQRYHSDQEFRENHLKSKKDRYHSDEKCREAVRNRKRESRSRKKAELVRGPSAKVGTSLEAGWKV